MICTYFSMEMAEKKTLKSFKFTDLIEELEFTLCSKVDNTSVRHI